MKIILMCAFLCLLSACVTVYIPNSVNTPLLKEKKEYRVGINTGSTSFDIQTAYSPFNHVSLMSNLSRISRDAKSEKLNMFLGEFALGSYQSINDRLIFEEYIGYGNGSVNNFEKDTNNDDLLNLNDHVKGKYHKTFVQFNCGYLLKNAEISIANRISYVDFYDLSRPESHTNDKNNSLFHDVAGTIKVGSEHFKVTGQLGLCSALNENVGNYERLIFSMGIQYSGIFR